MSARWQSCPHPFHELDAQRKGAGFMSEPTAVDDEWRTRGSSLGTGSILNEAGVCELLKRLSSFSAPSPSLSPFSPSLDLIFLSHTLLSSLGPSFLLSLLPPPLGGCEGGSALFVNQYSQRVCTLVWFEWCWLIQCCPWRQIWPISQAAITASKISRALRQSLFTAVRRPNSLTSIFFLHKASPCSATANTERRKESWDLKIYLRRNACSITAKQRLLSPSFKEKSAPSTRLISYLAAFTPLL